MFSAVMVLYNVSKEQVSAMPARKSSGLVDPARGPSSWIQVSAGECMTSPEIGALARGPSSW